MKKKKFKWGSLVVLLTVILAIIAIILLIIIIVRGVPQDTNSNLVNDLYTYLGQNDLSYCQGLNTYSDKTITYDDLENSDRVCNAVADLYLKEESTLVQVDKTKKNNTCSIGEDDSIIFATDNYEEDLCSIYRIDKSKIADRYKEIYGKELENYYTVQLNNTTICYPDGDYYYCGLSETFTVTVGAEPQTFRSISGAYKKGDDLIIYDYFIKVVNNECYTSYNGETKNEACTSNFKDSDSVDYDYLKKYGTSYKHTFHQNEDGSYYWVKTENN